MLILFLLQLVVVVISVFFSWLPTVTVLPTIVGVNLDVLVSTGLGYVQYLGEVVPPIAIMYAGFLFVIHYKISLMILRLFKLIH